MMSRSGCPPTVLLTASLISAITIATAIPTTTPRALAHEGPHPQEAANEGAHEKLPQVLILGDSISIGYTPFVQQLLAGKATVHRPQDNCGPTTRGLQRLDQWLGDTQWDVIHFNFGLHDLKYADEQGELVDVSRGSPQVPINQYVANLQELTRRLRATDAALIWCTTTPIPEGAKGRVPGDAKKYNAAARRIMRRELGEDLIITDLFQFSRNKLDEIQREANVHFTEAGSRQLAERVASSILAQLPAGDDVDQETARGTVFNDRNANGVFDSGDAPLPGIRVSNGCQIVLTDAKGRYELPVSNDTAVFVIKPRGYRTPFNEQQLPQFYYLHKPDGSPDFRFAGVSPTGPLPESIDFPLMPQKEPQTFKAIMFGDPQPRNQQEVDFIAHDVVEELIGTDASLGVTLGDIAFDNLDTLEPLTRTIAVLGIPWYNVLGNHDLNFDAATDDLSDETFERVFGPSYYSFDYGPVHFLVLDDVEWLVDDRGKGHYQGGLGKRQMDFIRRDLQLNPQDQLVVLMMHIPLVDVRDRHELFRLIEKRPFSMSISAHTHTHVHRFLKKDDGWQGPEPHHHVINVTVSGSWWAGQRDERGVPHAVMSDGAPNGYSIITFNGHEYSIDFKAAGRSKDYQMAIHAPEVVRSDDQHVTVYANVFNGSERSDVTLAVAGQSFSMQRVSQHDPHYVRLREKETKMRDRLLKQGVAEDKLWRTLPNPNRSSHLWKVQLPTNLLRVGTNLLHVEAQLTETQSVDGKRLLRMRE